MPFMKVTTRHLAALVALAMLCPIALGQALPEPVPKRQVSAPTQQVQDASGKWITNDHGANLNIGPNGDVHFGNAGGAPVMTLLSGWIYLYEGGWIYKIRQSDMKLVAKLAINPDAMTEPAKPPAPKKKTTKRRR